MPKSLPEYLDWLDQRPNLIWPKPPATVPLKATPYLKPLPEVKAVVWSIYGTLLHIDTGRLQHQHPQPLRMQIALQKTIDEFKMWASMSRKPGQPWEYMFQIYNRIVDDLKMASTKRKGDLISIDSSRIWTKVIERLGQKEYQYDVSLYGDIEQLAGKIAYYFHANLQGVAANPNAADTILRLAESGVRQGLLDDGQSFTVPQLMRALKAQADFTNSGRLFGPDTAAISYRWGVRKPSPTLFEHAVTMWEALGLAPAQVLYVTHQLRDDLSAAKAFGFRTALFAADKNLCQFSSDDFKQPELKPDRLMTDLKQIRALVSG